MILIRCSRYQKCSWAKLTKRFEKCLWLVEVRYPDGSTNQLRSDTLRHQLMEFLSCSFLIHHFAVKLVVAECFLMQPPELYQHTLCKWFSVYPCQKILLDIVTIFRECKPTSPQPNEEWEDFVEKVCIFILLQCWGGWIRWVELNSLRKFHYEALNHLRMLIISIYELLLHLIFCQSILS